MRCLVLVPLAGGFALLVGCSDYGLVGSLTPVNEPMADAAPTTNDGPWWEEPWAEPPEGDWDDPVNEGDEPEDGGIDPDAPADDADEEGLPTPHWD